LKEAIVLFGHGSREAQWARPFQQLAETLSRKTATTVRLAYLELMSPSLAEAIATLVNEGVTAIRVVPVFLGVGGHTRHDLPKLVEVARARHGGVQITLDAPIGEQASVIEAIAAAIAKKG
jgi:sirohydrochlorin cobaltochelatase